MPLTVNRTTHAPCVEAARLMAEALPHLVWLAGADGAVDYLNRRCREYVGLTADDARGWDWARVVHPDDLDRTTELWNHAVRSGGEFRAELRLRRRDGEYRWHLGGACPQGVGGEGIRWVGTWTDVHDLKAAEDARRRSEARFRALVEDSHEAFELLAADRTILYATPSVVRIGGRPAEELVGRRAFERCHPDDAPALIADYDRSLRQPGASLSREYRYRHVDGSWHWAEVTCTNLLHHPEVGAVAVNVRDVTARKKSEEALREREELLRNVIAHIPCGVFWKDRRSVFLGCNEQFARDHGFTAPDDVVGRTDADLPFARAEADGFRACDQVVMETGEPVLQLEETQTRPNGGGHTMLTSKVPLCDAAGAVVGVLGVYQDITQLKRLEERVRQAQKMEAVGQLAGGVAHDFNNLLTVINGFSDVVLATLHEHDPVRPMVAEVRKAGERATGLTRQLLAFGRKQILQHKVVDLNAVVVELAALLRRLIGEDIDLVVRPGAGPLRVRADPGQLDQVVMNLAVNARDAMPTGGRLTIETRGVELLGRPDVPPGPYAIVAVSDTGCGMSDEVKAHIFEPFFTTKEQGKGTGLGLATVYGIVKQSGGHVEVDTAPRQGATFRVYLPVVGGSRPGELVERGGGGLPRGTETVLVAEDEPGVRGLVRTALEQVGYTVLTAADAAEGAAVARAAEVVDLLLTDVVMPGGGGRELSERLRRGRPGLRVLYMSGYTDDSIVRHGVEHDRVNFIQKPFTTAALVRKVREVLDRTA